MSYTYDPSASVVPASHATSLATPYERYAAVAAAQPSSAYVYPHHQPFVPGVPLPLAYQPHPAMTYQPYPLQPNNDNQTSGSSSTDGKTQEKNHRTPIHAAGEPDGALPYRLPDKLGVSLGFPSQAATIPTLGECTSEGDLVTIRASGVPRWRLELKDEAWGAPIDAVCESKQATFRLQGASERKLTVRVCKATEDGTCGKFTDWTDLTPVVVAPAPAATGESGAAAATVPEPSGASAAPAPDPPAPPPPPPPSFVAAGFESSADEEAAAAQAAATAVQAAARGRRTRLEAKAVRHGLSAGEAAELSGVEAAPSSAAPPPAPPPAGLTAWAAGLGVHKLLAAALLPLDGASGSGGLADSDEARLRAVAALGTEEIAGRLASAGLSGLVDHVVTAVEALQDAPPIVQ
jgi:hypothetical protein